MTSARITLAATALAASVGLLACGGDTDNVCAGADSCEFSLGSNHQLLAERGDDGDWQLRVITTTGRTIWQTVPGAALVQAHVGIQDIEYNRGSFTFWAGKRESYTSRITAIDVSGDGAVVRGRFDERAMTYDLTFGTSADRVTFEVALRHGNGTPDPEINRTVLVYASDPDERFFGFGAQYSYVDMKGQTLPIWCQEQGHGRGAQPISDILGGLSRGSDGDWHTSYTCVPWYLTNSEYLVFDLAADDRVAIEVWGQRISGGIIAADNPLDLLESYTAMVGRMEPLPAWTQQGAVVRTFNDGRQAVLDQLDELEAAGTPVAGIWIEDWPGTRDTAFGTRVLWNWVPDEAAYPDLKSFLGELWERGVAPLAYFNPYLSDPSQLRPEARNLYAEAVDAGYLVLNPDGEVYLVEFGGYVAGIVDLTNPEAFDWLKGLIKAQIANGFKGWMADFGEALPPDAVLHSGADPMTYHNQYLLDWARLNREAAAESGVGDELVFFTRGGPARSPSQSKLFWLGDQLTTWDEYDGLKTVIPGLMSSGLSGFSLQHPDTGGWLSVRTGDIDFARDPELFGRWLELSAFTAFMRLHTTNRPDINTQYNSDPDTFAHFSRFSRLFALLADYRATLMEQARIKGYPLLRHLMLHYPDDPAVYDLTQEFLLGSELLVAPVVSQGATSVEVYFPAGQWVHLWSDTVYGDPATGSRAVVAAPLGEPAVFYRKGSADGEALVTKLIDAGLRN